MTDLRFVVALEELNRAPISDAAHRLASKLLVRVNAENGHITITWDAMLKLAGCSTQGGARRHLSNLQKEGIIHYSTNNLVYVNFRALSGAAAPDVTIGVPDRRAHAPDQQPQEQDRRAHAQGGEGDPEGDSAHSENGVQHRRAHAQDRRASAPDRRARAQFGGVKGGNGWIDGWKATFSDMAMDPSLLPADYGKPSDEQAELTRELLNDPYIGVPKDLADIVAPVLYPQEVFEQCLRWLEERRLQSHSLGLLLYRLAHQVDCPPQTAMPGPRREGYYFLRWRDHFTDYIV